MSSQYLCAVWFTCLVFYCSMYLSHILCACVVHYIEVGCPQWRRNTLKPCHVIVAIIACWFVSAGIAVGLGFYTSPWHVCLPCRAEHIWDALYFLLYMAVLLAGAGTIVALSVFTHFYVKKNLAALRSSSPGAAFISRSRMLQLTRALNIAAGIFLCVSVLHHVLIFFHLYSRRSSLTSGLEQVLIVALLGHAFMCPVIYASKVMDIKQAMRAQLDVCLCRRTRSRSTPQTAPSSGVALQSVSKPHLSPGTLLALHTSLSGKPLKMPRIIVSDFDRRGSPTAGAWSPMRHPHSGSWSRSVNGSWYDGRDSLGSASTNSRPHYRLDNRDHLGVPETDL